MPGLPVSLVLVVLPHSCHGSCLCYSKLEPFSSGRHLLKLCNRFFVFLKAYHYKVFRPTTRVLTMPSHFPGCLAASSTIHWHASWAIKKNLENSHSQPLHSMSNLLNFKLRISIRRVNVNIFRSQKLSISKNQSYPKMFKRSKLSVLLPAGVIKKAYVRTRVQNDLQYNLAENSFRLVIISQPQQRLALATLPSNKAKSDFLFDRSSSQMHTNGPGAPACCNQATPASFLLCDHSTTGYMTHTPCAASRPSRVHAQAHYQGVLH